ncbi:MAG: type I phosphomannose isomerase catalytic subunit [Luteolibacter sp.]|uniref:type I phosphomannose isomerase catalytic subunit n=1 Tax=Luteolibacter sp. TaxID=1962973 RepID=UPI003263DC86
MEPITFKPLYMQRVWGGRELERVYARHLPDPAQPYGESWEIVDRENEQSVVDQGTYHDSTLHDLWMNHREEIFGEGFSDQPRFPILIKVLDARDDLSIQVHPPAHLAASLSGEPKTEMWYIADCDPGAKLYVGLKNGITRADFEKSIADGTVADCVHAITPQPGESIFIPSGRLHAIGAGFLIHEIQQNSDTTYRVFDWNRLGLDGNPRELHVGESLASIDFQDFEPGMDPPVGDNLASCDYFKTDRKSLELGQTITNPRDDRFSILCVVEGLLESDGGTRFEKGRFILLPRDGAPLTALEDSTILQVTLPM